MFSRHLLSSGRFDSLHELCGWHLLGGWFVVMLEMRRQSAFRRRQRVVHMQRRVRFDRCLLMQRVSGGQFQGARRRFSVLSLPNGLLLINCGVNVVHDVRGWENIAQGQQR
jgi:hypothetical protein